MHFKVTGASSAVALKGSLLPLTYATPLALSNGAGEVNFGGQAGELFFKFTDGGTDEFAQGKDRVFTLNGSAQSIPDLTLNTAYGATHGFTLTFVPSGGAPLQIRGNVDELGQRGTSPGPAPGPVTFGPHDFSAAPLLFKAWYGPNPSDDEGAEHSLDDDVINSRTLTWTTGGGTNF